MELFFLIALILLPIVYAVVGLTAGLAKETEPEEAPVVPSVRSVNNETEQTPAGQLTVHWFTNDQGEPVSGTLTLESRRLPQISNAPLPKGAFDANSRFLKTGDLEFDQVFSFHGAYPDLVAGLHVDVRARLLELSRYEVTFDVVLLELSGLSPTPDHPRHPSQLRGPLIELATLLQRSPLTSLTDTAINDPIDTMRQRALDLLWTTYQDESVTHRIHREALKDTIPRIRLAAARRLRALEQLEALVEADIDADICHDALLALHELLAPADRIRRAALTAWSSPAAKLRLAALDILSKKQDPSLVDTLLDPASRPQVTNVPGVAQAATAYLMAHAPERAVPALEAWLDDAEEEGKITIIDALAERGTVSTVAELLPYTQGREHSQALRTAARAAVTAIQSRIQDAQAGRVSLTQATGEVGQVALADDERAARVSLARAKQQRDPSSGR